MYLNHYSGVVYVSAATCKIINNCWKIVQKLNLIIRSAFQYFLHFFHSLDNFTIAIAWNSEQNYNEKLQRVMTAFPQLNTIELLVPELAMRNYYVT